jgi:hypothetical protein
VIAHPIESEKRRIFRYHAQLRRRWKEILALAGASLEFARDSDRLRRQGHKMRAPHLHSLWRNAPKRILRVQPFEFRPTRETQFRGSYEGRDKQLHAQAREVLSEREIGISRLAAAKADKEVVAQISITEGNLPKCFHLDRSHSKDY